MIRPLGEAPVVGHSLSGGSLWPVGALNGLPHVHTGQWQMSLSLKPPIMEH